MNDWLESWTGLVLIDPAMLWLALLVALALIVRWRRGAPAVRFAPGAFVASGSSLPRSWRTRLLPLPRSLQVLGLLLVVVALARPVHRTPLPLETQGIDILLCLDTSSSMKANDLDPRRTRLDVAKASAATFIEGRPHDRIGLVCFARYPDVRCPPTLDHRALEEVLARVTTVASDSPEDATGIGTAVARAAQALRGTTSKSKVVILLTDGEENVASAESLEEIAPLHAAQLCEQLGIRAYTIVAGIGNPGRSGEWIPLDTTQVKRLAEKTGGEFFEARDAGALARVYATIDELEKVSIEEPRYEVEERFLPVLITAMSLLVAGRLLQSTLFEVLP